MSAAIISSIVFSVYAWKIAGLKKINSEYYGLSYIGICAALMIVIVSAETPPSIASMVCGVTCILLALKSKLFHRELMIINTLKQGIETNKAA
jgi:hypothetical protein